MTRIGNKKAGRATGLLHICNPLASHAAGWNFISPYGPRKVSV